MSKVDLRKFVPGSPLSLYDREVTASGQLQLHRGYEGKSPECHLCGGPTATKFTSDYINWSGIKDHLIRLAAHYTESYASDLLVSFDVIQRDLENDEVNPEGYFFGFRELGIDHGEWIQNQYNHSKPKSYYRAIWRLTISVSDDKSVEMSLHKVDYRPHVKEAA